MSSKFRVGWHLVVTEEMTRCHRLPFESSGCKKANDDEKILNWPTTPVKPIYLM